MSQICRREILFCQKMELIKKRVVKTFFEKLSMQLVFHSAGKCGNKKIERFIIVVGDKNITKKPSVPSKKSIRHCGAKHCRRAYSKQTPLGKKKDREYDGKQAHIRYGLQPHPKL